MHSIFIDRILSIDARRFGPFDLGVETVVRAEPSRAPIVSRGRERFHPLPAKVGADGQQPSNRGSTARAACR
jgi:hypothetical protein